ncbi:MAG: plipastatin/fengycin lipopeptide synthetase [Solirubrobacteraceae bacterium]|jgi:acyl carrier protein|nr:plipastatin/fengycin lipopeptide synthetase [Solirubrobacteraceae bacterium]
MRRLWEDVIGHGPLDPRSDFFENGGDSLKALELLDRVTTEFAVAVPFRRFLYHATIDALVSIVLAEQPS